METNTEIKNSILKTGTTILGIVCKDGIVMAADRQVTQGNVKGNKFNKIVKINDYSLMSYAGQAADAQRLAKILAAELKLDELRSRSRPEIRKAASLLSSLTYSSIRQPSMVPSIVASFFGGVNEDGSFGLYTIGPDGTIMDVEKFDADGSGMTFVIGFLERQYKHGISIKEGVELAIESLKSSTQRDLYSGLGIEVFTITKDGIKKVVDQDIIPEYKDKK
ncbi:MAG: hypothetical protein ABSG05_01110 [Candidatus Pacearchaeota archaeon]|jgi:proteasome beta subunit